MSSTTRSASSLASSAPRTNRLTTTLDEVEELLPRLPAAVLRLERALVGRTVDVASDAAGNVRQSVSAVNARTGQATRTVAGTARKAVETTVSSARTGLRTTTGQTAAQARRVGEVADAELSDTYEDAVDAVSSAAAAVDPSHDATTGYDRWTKADLYDKATEMDIPGRSSMSKSELLTAIRAH